MTRVLDCRDVMYFALVSNLDLLCCPCRVCGNHSSLEGTGSRLPDIKKRYVSFYQRSTSFMIPPSRIIIVCESDISLVSTELCGEPYGFAFTEGAFVRLVLCGQGKWETPERRERRGRGGILSKPNW
jgi:hypothetical protein